VSDETHIPGSRDGENEAKERAGQEKKDAHVSITRTRRKTLLATKSDVTDGAREAVTDANNDNARTVTSNPNEQETHGVLANTSRHHREQQEVNPHL
jgi:beta-phosphoglucomutase-like phosphatase (HAD superfamily)